VFAYFELCKICKETNPDIIHSWGGMPSIFAGLAARRCRKKMVNGMIANSECKPFTMDWRRSRLSFPLSDVIVSNSQIGLQAYGVSKSKGIVITNGFNTRRLDVRYDDKQTLKELAINNGQVLIGMVASINWRKDYPTFIRAALKILEKNRNLCFIIIGDGDDRQLVEQMIPSELRTYFRFLGNRHDVDRFISVFHIGVLASFAEGISNSIMEYMAFGKPVVASDVEGNRELVEVDKSAYLVEVGNENKMADKLLDLAHDSELARKMGEYGKQIIFDRYTEEQMTAKYLKLYNKLLAYEPKDN
jgi:glycosyltransferase involved in cell wall biosynthesis